MAAPFGLTVATTRQCIIRKSDLSLLLPLLSTAEPQFPVANSISYNSITLPITTTSHVGFANQPIMGQPGKNTSRPAHSLTLAENQFARNLQTSYSPYATMTRKRERSDSDGPEQERASEHREDYPTYH